MTSINSSMPIIEKQSVVPGAEYMLRSGRDESSRKAMGRNGYEWMQRNVVPAEQAGKFDLVLSDAIARAHTHTIVLRLQEDAV